VGSVVVILATAVSLVGVRTGAAAGSSSTRPPTVRYVVRAGDTLWGIAVRRVGAHGDPRPYVDRLVAANRLGQGTIHVGQRLTLPD
jgi:LysM repeat protein